MGRKVAAMLLIALRSFTLTIIGEVFDYFIGRLEEEPEEEGT